MSGEPFVTRWMVSMTLLLMGWNERKPMNKIPSLPRRPGRKPVTLPFLVLVLLLAASVGCDTVAEISFDIRKFDKVVSPGPAHISSCSEDDTSSQMRFMLLDQSGKVIRPGAQLANGTLDGTSFTANDVTVRDGIIYPVHGRDLVRCDPGKVDEEGNPDPSDCTTAGLDICLAYDPATDDLGEEFAPTSGGDVGLCRTACANDGDCASGSCEGGGCSIQMESDYCSTDADCPSGFECNPLDSTSSLKLCSESTDVTVKAGSLAFLSPPDDNALRALSIIMDNSGSINGKGVTEDDSTVRINRATDPFDARIAASKLFFLNLQNQSYKASTIISVWSFRGETASGVTPHTGDPAAGNPFVVNTQVANNALDQINQASDFGRSNVFIALEEVANNGIELGITRSRAWTIVLFTDGPDDSVVVDPDEEEDTREFARMQWQSNFQRALDAAVEAGATVHIIHLDKALGADGMSELKPDPENAMPFSRDAQGRFGPLAEYAQITCATGGNYIYVRDPAALNEKFDLLTDMLGGMWKVDVSIDTLARATVPNGPYRFGGTLTVSADDSPDSYFMTPLGDESAFGLPDKDDSRGLIFKRQGQDR